MKKIYHFSRHHHKWKTSYTRSLSRESDSSFQIVFHCSRNKSHCCFDLFLAWSVFFARSVLLIVGVMCCVFWVWEKCVVCFECERNERDIYIYDAQIYKIKLFFYTFWISSVFLCFSIIFLFSQIIKRNLIVKHFFLKLQFK